MNTLKTALVDSKINKLDRPRMVGILYGEFGSWKTVTAASCVETLTPGAEAWLVAADRGWESLRNHPDIFERVTPFGYQGLSQLSTIADEITGQAELLILDTVSQMQEMYVDFLMDNVTWSGNYREKSIPKKGSGVPAEEVPGMPDYHLARNKLRIPIRKILKQDIDVLFLCHVREPSFLEQQKGVLIRRPSVTQKLFEFIAREAHFVGFMEKTSKNPEATITFKTDPRTVAKSRIGLLRDRKINATELPKLLNEWKAHA